MTAEFKYTISIEKAEQTDDGLFIEGVASGLGVDSQGHEMDPVAIERFAAQIEERLAAGDPVPYLDWHKESVLSELGHVVKATIDPDWNLRVRVKLDEANEAARYLHQKIQQGKKFGMSVAGRATKFAKRYDPQQQKNVIRFFDITLKEVSNTTKPIWTPSFGTVLAKSVIDEAGAESVDNGGDTPEMSMNDTTELQPGATEAPVDETTPEASAEGSADTTAEAESVEVPVEKAGAKHSKASKAKFLAMYQEMGDLLRAEGILDSEESEDGVEKAESDDAGVVEPETTETDAASDSGEPEVNADEAAPADASAEAEKPADAAPEKSPREEELERALAEMTARAEAAEARSRQPQLVTPNNETSEPGDGRERVVEELRKLPREQRLAEAFRLRDEVLGARRR